MARILPSDVSTLSLSLGETAELRTLAMLRRDLPAAYTVFHSVHWSRDSLPRMMFGEADFVVVNRAGQALVIEQKSGALEETEEGLAKRYPDGRKSVAAQIHRTLGALREQFRRQSGREVTLDYLIYCPEHRVLDLNAAGLDASRIVDARAPERLADRVMACLAPGDAGQEGERVIRFFENRFHLVPDIHAHITAGERAMTRLSGGLADVVSAIEMRPWRLRVRGTAGSGKSAVAAQFAEMRAAEGKRPLLVCYNRPLAERLKATAPKGATANTFQGFMDSFLKARGHAIAYDEIGKPGFWTDVQERVIAETVPPDWRFDALAVDEGQDFDPEWYDILRLFLAEDAEVLWLEDPDQRVRRDSAAGGEGGDTPPPSFNDSFVGYRALANFRSKETISRYIRKVLPFEFEPANPLPGLGVGVSTYAEPAEQSKRVAAVVTDLLRRGFRHSDMAILSLFGLERSTLGKKSRVGNFTLSRWTGGYDLLGNQTLEPGQLRFETVRRFKGQQAPAVIVTDIDPQAHRFDEFQRLLFAAMTRATLRLDLLVREGNTIAEPLLAA